MAFADVRCYRWTGTAGAPTKTSVFGITTLLATDDSHHGGADEVNSVPIPAAGTNYSFWGSFRPNAFSSPAGTINALKVWTDGVDSSPTGVAWLGQRANVAPDAGYRQATGGGHVVGTTGVVLNTTNHTGIVAAPVSPFTWTSSVPLALSGSISNPSTGDFADFLILQWSQDSTGNATGSIPTEVFTVQWDET